MTDEPVRGQKTAALTPQVIGGTPSATGARPYQVALLSGGRQFCGGTLISDQWVLTAAHCVSGTSVTSISVRAGSLSATSGGQLKTVASGRVHPSYTDVTRGYDVAVLRVASPFTLGSTVSPAALPTPAFAASAAAVGTIQTISGWGMTVGGNSGSASTVLREANLPVISNGSCGSQLGQTIPNGMICGDKNSQGQTGCHGDSGGPFASVRNGKYFVFGVVSWGTPSVCNKATAFARVSEYQPWITTNTGVQPQGDSTTPPPNSKTYTGSVGQGASSYQPGTAGFTFGGGAISGALTGPSGTDFDLYLQKLSGSSWADVAASEGSTSTENLNYTAASGTYRWQVYGYSGSGSYTLTETK
ncbi:S1 family serine peptidase [Deinococcus betulae]|uniref:S1 family serine peptidase n=1 Tax=Deinococcus betulae TaxID=2873312 RepID=UPI0034E1C262